MTRTHQVSRRTALQAGTLSGMGVTLPQVLGWQQACQANEQASASAKSVILLYMTGGPAQQETFDPKTRSGDGYQGEYKPIPTSVPGTQVCELLPLLAKNAHRYSILRSIWHESNDHGIGTHSNLTGLDLDRKENSLAKALKDYSPCVGSVVSYFRGGQDQLPASVQLPNRIGDQNAFQWPGQRAGYLGPQHDPMMLIDEKWKPGTTLRDFTLPESISARRFLDRMELLRRIQTAELSSSAPQNYSRFQQQAQDILSSPTAWNAFDLKYEKPQMIDRYGDNRFGRSALVARRLVEAGVNVVTVSWMLNHSTENFDTHMNHFKLMKNLLLPPVDRAFAALLEDLDERGLLETTMVAWTGEFGRTPKINKNAGRDHWGPVYSTVLAGGGVRGGRVIGKSDKIAGEPVDEPHHVSDFVATIYHALGYSQQTRINDADNRPHDIMFGAPIEGLF
ncbi:MAG: hypothetical protein CMJ78_14620 [Planctomycetaceae bacterium]|nr:hypothetical protein [Planctomycetaceae bacterium]